MAGDDPASQRAALEAEAARLKAERLKAEQQRPAPVDLDGLAARNFGKSLRHLGQFSVAATLALVGAMLGWSTGEGFSLIGVPFFLGSLFVFGWFFTGVARFRRWRAGLPFELAGWERVLGLNQLVRKAALELEFKDTPAPANVLAELARARLGEGTTLEGLTLVTGELDATSTNWPTAQWSRQAVSKVLLDVHRGYPLKRVTLKALSTGEFHFSGGD